MAIGRACVEISASAFEFDEDDKTLATTQSSIAGGWARIMARKNLKARPQRANGRGRPRKRPWRRLTVKPEA